MGCCCSRPSSSKHDFGVAERGPRGQRGTALSPHDTAEAHCALSPGATTTHRLGCRATSPSSGSLTGIPNAVADVRKGPVGEHALHSSSDNSGSQPQSIPSGCLGAQRHRNSGLPREGDGDGRHPGSGVCDSGNRSGAAATVPMSASGSLANASRSATTGVDDVPFPSFGVSANALPARRGPKQALLSYAEQYRTLQPYLHRRFRNRRWRLVFSSDVHGQQLMDRCQRVFREEAAQWHAVMSAKLHHGSVPGNPAPDGEEAGATEIASTTSPSPYGVLPLIALMETNLVVPAPVHGATSSSATLHNATRSPDGGEALAADATLSKAAATTVVDSHVCIGLYLQHRPAPDMVVSYRRSEIFFFLFQSPIHPASSTSYSAAAVAAADGGASPVQAASAVATAAANAVASDTTPVVSAPPQSVTQTNRRVSRATSEMTSSDAGEESGELRQPSGLSSTPFVAKRAGTPRTQTHRLSNVIATSSGVQRRLVDSEEEGDASPPRIAATGITHDRRGETAVDPARAHVDPVRELGAERHDPPQLPSPTGIFSTQWQHRMNEIEQEAFRHSQTRTSPSPRRTGRAEEDEDEDAYSSVSAAVLDDAQHEPSERPQRSVTQHPLSSIAEPAASPHHQQRPPVDVTTRSSAQENLPAWAITNVDAVRSPNTPVSPHSVRNVPASGGPILFTAAAPVSAPRRHTPSPPMWDAHPLSANAAGASLTMEDDAVSASTTVVSATSVPGLAWREDEDLSSYWPDAAQTSSGGAAHASAVRGGAGGWQGREWYSPATGPQLAPLSRVSSFGGEDTAECLTPRLPREGSAAVTAAGAGAGYNGAFAVHEGLERSLTSPPVMPAGGAAPPLPGLVGGSAFANASGSSDAMLPLLPSATALGSAVGASRAELDMDGTSLPARNSAGINGNGLSHLNLAAAASSSERPVSTRVEVLTMTLQHDQQQLDGRTVSGEGLPHSEVPSRTPSQLLSNEGTIDVYCTSTGALYVWDPHRDPPNTAQAGAASTHHTADSREHEFVYQRDANGIRWNLSYFTRDGGVSGGGGGGGEHHASSDVGSPVGDAGHASLFTFVRAHAQRDHGAGALTSAAEVLASPVVKMQLCAVSSRALPTALQRPSSSAASPSTL